MKVDLAGLASNASDEIACLMRTNGNGNQPEYYEHALHELYQHVLDVRCGAATVEEFCKHYCIKREER